MTGRIPQAMGSLAVQDRYACFATSRKCLFYTDGLPSSKPKHLSDLTGVCIYKDTALVCDTYNKRVLHFTMSGKVLRALSLGDVYPLYIDARDDVIVLTCLPFGLYIYSYSDGSLRKKFNLLESYTFVKFSSQFTVLLSCAQKIDEFDINKGLVLRSVFLPDTYFFKNSRFGPAVAPCTQDLWAVNSPTRGLCLICPRTGADLEILGPKLYSKSQLSLLSSNEIMAVSFCGRPRVYKFWLLSTRFVFLRSLVYQDA